MASGPSPWRFKHYRDRRTGGTCYVCGHKVARDELARGLASIAPRHRTCIPEWESDLREDEAPVYEDMFDGYEDVDHEENE